MFQQSVPTISLIGVGVMGEAILASFIAAVGRSNVRITDGRAEHGQQVASDHQVRWAASNVEAVTDCDVVVIAVKPQDFDALAHEIRPHLNDDVLVVSVAAGVTTSRIREGLGHNVRTVRVMPNTPATIGRGVCALSGGEGTTRRDLDLVAELLAGTGTVEVVPEELQDTVTAISGSGPAYVFYLIEAMTEAGAQGGLDRSVAQRLATQTVAGAAAMAASSDVDPVELRRRVTSPGGTTAAAIEEFDARGVAEGVIAGARKAWERSRELGAD
ncbi:MAG TPA: pyrroline-5-carboxylate reductase [Beutenbergiaceae bacterium]|nr:pyrroline-5-carboxylate reductase [Beutenbergiaceae bacterium]